MGTLVLCSWPVNFTPKYQGKTSTSLLLAAAPSRFLKFYPWYRHSLFFCKTQWTRECSSRALQDCSFCLNGRRPVWCSDIFRLSCNGYICNTTHVRCKTLKTFSLSLPSLGQVFRRLGLNEIQNTRKFNLALSETIKYTCNLFLLVPKSKFPTSGQELSVLINDKGYGHPNLQSILRTLK